MKLFMIYIGGTVPQSLIELHDMRFVIADKIEDTYEDLKKTWWGDPKSLHLDAWGQVTYADGYDIQLKTEPSKDSENKLFFVNLGGYDKSEFTELHKNVLVVAKNASNAKVLALKQILDWKSHHRDYQYEVDSLMNVNNLLSSNDYYIHLTPSEENKSFEFTVKYVPLG